MGEALFYKDNATRGIFLSLIIIFKYRKKKFQEKFRGLWIGKHNFYYFMQCTNSI